MGYEIDFLPVGEESSGGDAIALRYGNLYGTRAEQTVIVIDGGYTDCGTAMVEHIRTRYGTDRVDIVVSTHPDQDHVTGLEVVVEEMEVGQLWMHLPWNHSGSLAEAKARNFKHSQLSDKLEKSLSGASDLEAIARRLGVPIIEPFTGTATADGCFTVLGPTLGFYEELLLSMPEGSSSVAKHSLNFLLSKLSEAAKSLVPETMWVETLRNDGETSPRNNSSTICLLDVDGHKSLFTGDAGMPALGQVADLLEALGFVPGELSFVQIPHHGSRRNVGPDILDRLLGPKGQASGIGEAFVSAPKKNPENKHPAKKVTNAFHRRGYAVHATQGVAKWHHRDAPGRSDYVAAIPTEFFASVEDDGGA